MFAKTQTRGAATLVAFPVDPSREAQAARAVLPHVRAGTAVLDLCCGAGWSTLLLTAHADKVATRCPVVAWDPDPQALLQAAQHIADANFEQRTRLLQSMPTGARFDLVYLSHRAWARTEAGGLFFREALACADDVLRTGGTIAMVLPKDHLADGLQTLQRRGYTAVLAGTDRPIVLAEDLEEPQPDAGLSATELSGAARSGTEPSDTVLIAHRSQDRCGFPVQVHLDQGQLLCAFDLARTGTLPPASPEQDTLETAPHDSKDAEVLCGLAASHPGPCLDLGTGHGRNALQLAINVGRNVVTTVDMLPEHAAAAGKAMAQTRDEIGRIPRQHSANNIRQLYANTQDWNWLDVPFGLHLASIDAGRTEADVLADSLEAWRRLAPGGFLVWHDFSPAAAPDNAAVAATMAAVRRFRERVQPHGKIHHLIGSWCGVLQKEERDA